MLFGERRVHDTACTVYVASSPAHVVAGAAPYPDFNDAPHSCLQEFMRLRALYEKHVPPQA